MEAFQLRLWDGRIGRWLSPDPAGQYSSPYLGMGNNPINGIDPNRGSFYPTVGDVKALGRGLWTETKGLFSSLWYLGDTIDSAAAITELGIASSGILGGSPYFSPYTNLVIYDAQYTKTNTAGLYLAIGKSINNYYTRITSDNSEVSAEAFGEAFPAILSLKGLGSLSKMSVIAEAGTGGEILALQASKSQLLLGEGVAKSGMSDLQLVTRAAENAEATIRRSGGVAGTLKHTYAKNLVSRYQSIYGDRGFSLGSNYFNNNALRGLGNKGFLDVVNHKTNVIYDFKFGDAFMSNSQYLKYSNNFPGYRIEIIKP
jgi:hypothetical protein